MSDEFASFRELRGIGPAIEKRLHEAGVHTWQALSDVLLALHGIRARTDNNSLRELAELAAARAAACSDAVGDGPGSAEERSESFLVRVVLAAGGAPSRTSVTRVRTQATRSYPGWPAHHVAHFVEEALEPQGSATSDSSPDPEPARAAPTTPESAPARSVSVAPEPARAAPAVLDHCVVLLAGTVIGGGVRSLAATVATGDLPDGEDLSYEAVLVCRPLGDPDPDSRNGAELARRAGRGRPPEPVELAFPEVAVPAGIQRLRIVVTARLTSARPGPLPLVLSGFSSSAVGGDGYRSEGVLKGRSGL